MKIEKQVSKKEETFNDVNLYAEKLIIDRRTKSFFSLDSNLNQHS